MEETLKKIDADVKSQQVLLFMKGNKMFPQCGFSKVVVDILQLVGVPFETRDVLEDAGVREGIKQYSNWPTIPQLYVKGEFVGGCDIVREMYEKGELESLLKPGSEPKN